MADISSPVPILPSFAYSSWTYWVKAGSFFMESLNTNLYIKNQERSMLPQDMGVPTTIQLKNDTSIPASASVDTQ